MKNSLISSNLFRLHPFLEFFLILFIALGDFIVSAFKWLTIEGSGNSTVSYGNDDILNLLIYETIVLIIIVLILKWQQWSLKDFGLRFSIDKITAGLVLFISHYLMYLLLFSLFGDFFLDSEGTAGSSATISFSTSLNILPLTLFSIFNPIFEEFILVGYIVSAMRNRFGIIACVFISMLFRVSFHIYQGPIILLSILPMGIMYAVFFWYKRSILPLVIGHGLMDFLSFFVLMTIQGNQY
ncbi:MAG: CPBP family intramembrane metalloprotease [Calditrichaeota bacterium]|nr:MAG: CPBP family intramembrane metalloprotease [Calditrichota bacterium]MBL1206402.1 CPBP family intramembrane metalloprotease [Calditrichota bacterium]NOG46228.1 CPBP family intramembrane metalloprotease [Calditrichota bacterium]